MAEQKQGPWGREEDIALIAELREKLKDALEGWQVAQDGWKRANDNVKRSNDEAHALLAQIERMKE